MRKNVDIKWYQTLDSTNTQAAREISQAPDGTVWIADFQTAGRGQRGNRWESAKCENLTFSILFKPTFLSPAQQFAISEVAAIGVCRYLCSKGLPAQIKWPNDIYIGNKKICGMLIEHSISGANLAGSIVGIGLNLNQREFSSDAPNPTSLLLEIEAIASSGATTVPPEGTYDRREELSELLGYIFTAYGELEDGFAAELNQEYLDCLYRFNQWHRFIEIDANAPADMPVEKMAAERTITARITGIDPYGCVILEHQDGTVQSYPFKGIRYII